MIGRQAFYRTWDCLADADRSVFGAEANPALSRRQVNRSVCHASAALLCPAHALSCLALPCPALPCPAQPWLLRHTALLSPLLSHYSWRSISSTERCSVLSVCRERLSISSTNLHTGITCFLWWTVPQRTALVCCCVSFVHAVSCFELLTK